MPTYGNAVIRGVPVIVDFANPLVPIKSAIIGPDTAYSIGYKVLENQDRVVRVKDYEAKGDGVTDDTAAIKNAITAAGIGGTVYYDRGTYLVGQSLANQYVFNLPSAGQSHVTEEATIKLAGNTAIGTGIFWMNGSDQRISGLTFDLSGVQNASAIHTRTACVRGTVAGNTFLGSAAVGGMGVNISGNCYDLFVHGNHFFGCAYGVISGAATSPVKVLVADNILDGNNINTGSAIQINSPNGNASDIIFTGNVVNNWTSVQTVLSFAHVLRGVISGNLIRNCSGSALHVEDGTTNVAINGNTVSGCGGAGVEVNSGARICRHITICGNVLANCLTLAPTTGAIGVAGTAQSEEIIIQGNLVDTCGLASAAQCWGIGLYGNNSRVLGNIVNNTQGQFAAGIKLFSGSDNLIAQNRCFDNQGVKTQDYGLSVSNAQTRVQIYDNNFDGNGISALDESGIGATVKYFKRDNIGIEL